MSANLIAMSHDMSDLCRVCLLLPEESQYLDLTTIYDEEDNLTYGDCFTICTEIDLSTGEGLPHNLCKPCGLELQMSYDFHKKIEESKRVIKKYQKQLKLDRTKLTASREESKKFNMSEEEKAPMADLNEKYIISVEEQLADEAEEMCVLEEVNEEEFVTPLYEETNEIEIIDITQTETSLETQVLSPDNNAKLIDTIRQSDEVHLDIEDYQNLEEEETETLQIKYDENINPIHRTKFKSGEILEYVECVDDYNEKENEEQAEEMYEEYAQEINEKDIESDIRWQENVVAVANEDHLPLVIESDKEEGEAETISFNSEYKNDKISIIVRERSHNDESEEAADKRLNICENDSSKNTDSKSMRKRHMGAYSCDYCHRVYPNYSRMKTHRRCHETDRVKFYCSHCGRIYATKQARDCHIQTAHDKFGHACNICSKVFATRKTLEIHIRYHTGDFPYKCKLCDRKFAQGCHLKTHINVKHNQIRFSCQYPNCGKFFTSSSALRTHEYSHGIMPFECELCCQGFPAKAKLRIHIQRKHSIDMTDDELEKMRKFHVMRSKVNLVQFVDA